MGSLPVPVFTPSEQLTGLVSALSVTPDDCEIFVVSQVAAKVTADAGSPSTCVEILLRCCEANWQLSKSATSAAVSLCYIDAMNSTPSGSFRAVWLKRLQSLFLRK